jgi:RAT1-interacting protein
VFTLDLRKTITEDGVWRIQRKERSSFIEISRVEETGHGDILSDEFINWRIKLALGGYDTGGGEGKTNSTRGAP